MGKGHVWFQKQRKQKERRYERPKHRGGLSPIEKIVVPKPSRWPLVASLLYGPLLAVLLFFLVTPAIFPDLGVMIGIPWAVTTLFFAFCWRRDRKLYFSVEKSLDTQPDHLRDASSSSIEHISTDDSEVENKSVEIKEYSEL